MKIIWSINAEHDRMDIWNYIVSENPQAAIDMDDLFESASNQLSLSPFLGEAGQIAGTRELVIHKHYRLIYEINSDNIAILALVHTARLWPLR